MSRKALSTMIADHPRLIIPLIGIPLALASACSSGTKAPGAASSSHSRPPATSSTPASATPTPTPTRSAGLPTYSEVVATYPSDVTKCDTEANMMGTSYKVTKGSVHFSNGAFQVLCYGVKITVTESSTVAGKTYAVGTKLTVDAKMN